ncbi:MAG: AAA family ATPase, partial [Desulfobacterales bacterium]|nr:AAA family ATPase [Desulfobacterales bacterium]
DLLYRLIRTPEPVENPLEAHGLILIDEIDLHLHPVWQRKLRRFLKKTLPNFQILATTHSPLTAQQTDRGELFITRRPEPGRPPALSVYPGAPRRLLIQQLLTGPAFGVETVHEEETAEVRQRYRALRDKPDRTPQEEVELDELREQVASMSPPSSGFDPGRKFAAALDKFTRALERGEP